MNRKRSRIMSRHARWIAAGFALSTAGAAHTQGTGGGAAPAFDTSSQVYRCMGGAKLPVVYLNIKGGDSFATTYVNGRLVLMRSGPTGSGARYVAVDEQPGYRWHVKGEVGSLFFLGAEPGARETLVLQDCKVQRQP
jgi:membrane-bound inhibitor of C-type lysozyme